MDDGIVFLFLVFVYVALTLFATLVLFGLLGAASILWQHLRRQVEWRRLNAQLKRQWPGLL